MKLKLVNKKSEARETYSFFFEPNTDLNFKAGQYIYITLPKLNYEDERGATRHFTFANSPTEGNLVQITTRIRPESGYKKTLNELGVGDVVEGKEPNGYFVFDEKVAQKTKNNIFLAGGIGITPFRSMIKYNIDKNIKALMHLIYSNSNEEFVFKNELDKWQEENDFIQIDYIDTSKVGRIDEEKLSKFYETYKGLSSTSWIVGPPKFVNAMEDILEKIGIDEDDIRIEKFTGY